MNLPKLTYDRLKFLNLLKKKRGYRGGVRFFKHRPIRVITGNRTILHNEQLQQAFNNTHRQSVPCNAFARHLVSVPIHQPAIATDKSALPRILLTNARSLNNKMEELILIVNSIEAAAVTETWFNDIILQASNIPGFTCFTKCRQGRRGGGVAVYTKHSLNVQLVNNHSCDYECMWLKFNLKQFKSSSNLYMGVIYYDLDQPMPMKC